MSTWDQALECINDWLRNVRAEDEPDLWRETGSESGAGGRDSGYFSPEERAELSEALHRIADQLAERRSLSIEERQVLEIRFVGPLEEASGKLTRGQWKAMFVGALITEGVRVGLDPSVIKEISMFAAQLIGHLFGGGLPALPLAT